MCELIVCGETEVSATNIRINIDEMKGLIMGKEAVTGFQKQFKV